MNTQGRAISAEAVDWRSCFEPVYKGRRDACRKWRSLIPACTPQVAQVRVHSTAKNLTSTKFCPYSSITEDEELPHSPRRRVGDGRGWPVSRYRDGFPLGAVASGTSFLCHHSLCSAARAFCFGLVCDCLRIT